MMFGYFQVRSDFLFVCVCALFSLHIYSCWRPCWPSGKASVLRAADPGFDSHLQRGDFSGANYSCDLKFALQWLPCQAPGIIGSGWDWLAWCQYAVTG